MLKFKKKDTSLKNYNMLKELYHLYIFIIPSWIRATFYFFLIIVSLCLFFSFTSYIGSFISAVPDNVFVNLICGIIVYVWLGFSVFAIVVIESLIR